MKELYQTAAYLLGALVIFHFFGWVGLAVYVFLLPVIFVVLILLGVLIHFTVTELQRKRR